MPFMLKKTLQAVLESGNDYLVAVKGNQPKLLALSHTPGYSSL
jgi:hypothetical protein